MGIVENPQLTEVSGIVMSSHDSIIWAHNDGGKNATIYALSIDGRDKGSYTLSNVNIRDWEDITCGPGPENGKTYLYVGDIGDNNGTNSTKFIYRFLEPKPQSNNVNKVITDVDPIPFSYPNNERYDSETLMIDPLTKDLYIITKREFNNNGIYNILFLLPYPQKIDGLNRAIALDTLNDIEIYKGKGAVGGSISKDGGEILIKSLKKVYYWRRTPSKSISDAFQDKAISVSYESEYKGEALCWDNRNSGYFTLSESKNGEKVHLYYYPRVTKINPTGLKSSFNELLKINQRTIYFTEPVKRISLFSLNGRKVIESHKSYLSLFPIAKGIYMLEIDSQSRILRTSIIHGVK